MTTRERPNAESENVGEEVQLAPYFIDAKITDLYGKSLSFLVAGRMCWMCRQGWDDYQVILSEPRELIGTIAGHCATQQDYLLPDTPLREAIFRALLANANAPMTANEISAVLTQKWAMTPFPRDTSPEVIQRLMDSDAYYCIGPASETDIGVTIKKPHGGRRRTTTKEPDPPKPEPEPKPSIQPDYGDPFQPTPGVPATAADFAMSDRFAKLLYWLSSYGDGTLQTFAQACKTLNREQEWRGGVGSVIRRLRLLGHLELSDDGSKWSAAPSAFVRFSDGSGNGFLAGMRTLSLLADAGSLCVTNQPDHMGPPRVETTWDDPRNSATNIADAGAVSTDLAQLLPSVNAWKATLPTRNPVISDYDAEVWDGTKFIPCVIYEGDSRPSGMYALSRTLQGREIALTLFYDQSSGRWLSGDWYGLRFLALQAAGFETRAIHVSDTNELLIPDAQRMPMLYERALVLASGLLPDRAPNRNWLKYGGIPIELARTLCGKLNVQLEQETNRA